MTLVTQLADGGRIVSGLIDKGVYRLASGARRGAAFALNPFAYVDSAYQNNPTLTAQRAAQRANDENVPIARAGGRPVLSANTGINENFIRSGNNFTTPERLLQGNVGVTLPLYQGGRVRNGVQA
ncbi:hypothetical protein LTR94_032022, partial [Friedmanniomyces endolithicus]